MRTFDPGNSEQSTPITAAEQALFDGILLRKRPIYPSNHANVGFMLPAVETCHG